MLAGRLVGLVMFPPRGHFVVRLISDGGNLQFTKLINLICDDICTKFHINLAYVSKVIRRSSCVSIAYKNFIKFDPKGF